MADADTVALVNMMTILTDQLHKTEDASPQAVVAQPWIAVHILLA